MSGYLVKEISAAPRVRLHSEVAAARGGHRLTELVLRSRRAVILLTCTNNPEVTKYSCRNRIGDPAPHNE
jgi:hypothetical protein